MADKTVTVGPGRDYATLQAAYTGEYSANPNLVTMDGILNIVLYAMDDTTAVTDPGFAVDSSHYIDIHPAVGEGHEGVWNGDKVNLSVSGNVIALRIASSYTRVTGMQIGVAGASDWGNDPTCIRLGASVQGCVISGNILRNQCNQAYHFNALGVYGAAADSPGGGHKIFNNIFYGFQAASYGIGAFGVHIASSGNHIHSNTFVDCQKGVQYPSYSTTTAKNNLFASCTTPIVVGTGATAYSDYNATDQSSFGVTYTANTHDHVSHTFTFVDADNDNYLLDAADEGAIGDGADLSGDADCPFSTDITGASRDTPWSIGASQPASGPQPVSLDDTETLSEEIGVAATTPVSLSESESESESATQVEVAVAGVSESGGVDESASETETAVAGVSESGQVDESDSAAGTAVVGVAESGDVGESGDGTRSTAADVNESGTVDESTVGTETAAATLTEEGTVQESIASTMTGTVGIGEVLEALEDATASGRSVADVAEELGLTEEQTTGLVLFAALVEAVAHDDGVATLALALGELSEGGSVDEGISTGGSTTWTVNFEDGSTLSEGVAAGVRAVFDGIESVDLQDVFGHVVAFVQGLAEQHGLTEEQTVRLQAILSLAEQLSNPETLAGGLVHVEQVEESIATADESVAQVAANPTLAEAAGVTDAIAGYQEARIAFEDYHEALEEARAGKVEAIDLDEALGISDAVDELRRSIITLGESVATAGVVDAVKVGEEYPGDGGNTVSVTVPQTASWQVTVRETTSWQVTVREIPLPN